jgi:hypothetical protein
MINLIAKAENMEIRGCESKTNKKGEPYLIVSVDDERGKRSELVDKDMENEPYYKRGTIADFWLTFSIGKYASVTVSKVEIRK